MSQMPHIDTDTLSAYLDGAVAAVERRRIEAHLETCATCRLQLAELQATVTILRGLPQYEPRRSFRVAATVPGPTGLPVRLLPIVRPLAIAAVLLFAIVTGAAFLQDDPSSDLQPPSGLEQEAPVEESGGDAARQGTNRPTQTSLMTEATTAVDNVAGGVEGDTVQGENAAQDAAAPESADEEQAPMAALEVQDASPTAAAGEVIVDEAPGQPAARQSQVEDARIDGWELASAALGLVAAGLLVAWAVLARVSSRQRR